MVEKSVTNTIAENVSTVGCSIKPVEYSHANAGSIATPGDQAEHEHEARRMDLGRQRSEAE